MRAEYVDHMGDDLTVVNAARVSFDKHHTEFTQGDEKLIKYLASHGHISPFFHPQIQLRITVPIFVSNQLKRHQVGLAINEVSRRYVATTPEFYYPDKLGRVAVDKKQGAKKGEFIDLTHKGSTVGHYIKRAYEEAAYTYGVLLSIGVASEDARMVLPLATYTSFIWTGSLYAYARMYNLRNEESAQRQTREVAEQIGAIIAPLFPISWPVLTEECNV